MPGTQTATGLAYLELATRLLQRVRRHHPTAGLWEAADLQWWWRTARSSDAIEQTFWLDDDGEPVAAVILVDWTRAWSCDFLLLPGRVEMLDEMWAHAARATTALGLPRIEVAIEDDDRPQTELATAHGLRGTEGRGVTGWMEAVRRPAVSPLPAGYRLRDRHEPICSPHHLIRRSGAAVADRLAQTSLYRSDLDLFVEHESGEVAGYGLFWYDSVSRIGLVEPMRTEQGHEGQGLARHVLTEGLARLAALGPERLKVSYDDGNDRARRLYLSAGFEPSTHSTVYAGSL